MWHPFDYIPYSWQLPLLAVLLVLTVFVAIKTNQPLNIFPINALELAPNERAAQIIIDCWRRTDRDLKLARLLQFRDNFFIPCYSTFLALGCFIVAERLFSSEPTANLHGRLFAWLMLVAGILDFFVENHAINKMLNGNIVQPWPTVSTVAASIKFVLIGTGSVYMLSSLVVCVLRK